MKSLHRQKGLGAFGWIFVIAIIAGAAALTIRITPHYISFHSIQGIVEGLDAETLRGSKGTILETIDKRLRINSLYDIKARDIVNVTKNANDVTFDIDYEEREPLFGMAFSDVGLYLHFKQEISRHSE